MVTVTKEVECMRKDLKIGYSFDLNLSVDDVVDMMQAYTMEEMANFNIVTESSDNLGKVM